MTNNRPRQVEQEIVNEESLFGETLNNNAVAQNTSKGR